MNVADPNSYMKRALALAERAARAGEVPVGAVIVLDGEVISEAYNEVEAGAIATNHAEMLAIERASEKLRNWRLSGASLFVTLEPCPMCLGAMLLSRVSEVYFGCNDPVQGAAGSAFDLSSHPLLPHSIKVYSGILEIDCRMLLQDFFRKKRISSRLSTELPEVKAIVSQDISLER